ncbi:MAG: hypothetical protein WCC63_07860, partial [Candidatus Bathyarchaeia archaeon]
GYAISYAVGYADVLADSSKVHLLSSLTKDKRRLVMIALANLSKYLGIYEHWRSIVKNAGLKWEKRSALETFVSILNSNVNDTAEWLRDIVKVLPKKYATVVVFNALTGLRPTEGCCARARE